MEKMEEKLDKLIDGQERLQESFNLLADQQKVLTNKVENLSQKVETTRIKLEDDVDLIRKRSEELEKSVMFFSEQYEENKKANCNLIKRIETLEKQSSELYNEITNLHARSNNAEVSIDSIENQSRKIMLEINGIPVIKDEETKNRNWCHEKVSQLCKLMDVEDVERDIDVAHRLYNNNIIVLFKNRTSRDRFYYARFNLKGKCVTDLNIEKPASQKGLIWVNESLTSRRKWLLAKTKVELKKKGFVIGKEGIGIFTSLGKIKVLSKGKTYEINHENDITKFVHSSRKTVY